MTSPSEFEKAEEAARLIQKRTALRPRVGLVLGSGLGAFADSLTDSTAVPYREIPHFPLSTAVGHPGRLIVGCCQGVPLAALQGRVHFYEGYKLREVVFPVRVLARLGVQSLVLTNAAGGINRKLKPPSLLLIRDHINLQGSNPLVGANEEAFGPRFPDMSEAYSRRLRVLAKKIARRLRMRLPEGVYVAVHGPSYETPAEVQALARLGADVVGMSTVPEVIAANHMGLAVLGLSCVSNLAAGLSRRKINHEEVLVAGERLGRQFGRFLEALVRELDRVKR
jgi:purine-nucleoside phosphorylase